MAKNKIITALTALALISASFIIFQGCSKEKSTGQGPIKLAVAGPFTGNAAAFGDMIKKGANLFVKELNAAGGINGRKVELVYGDDAADPKEAAIVATKFATNKSIPIVIGHFNSSCTLAGRPIYAQYGVVEFSPGSTNPTVTEGSKWTFRNVYRDDVQGPAIARYIKEVLKKEKVGAFYDNDDYGIGLKDAFVKEAKKIGLGIVGVEAYTRESTDFTPQITKLAEAKPDIIFISGLYNEAALISAQSRKLAIKVQLIGADGSYSADLIKIGGQAVEGYLLSVPYVFTEDDPFAVKFKKEYGTHPDAWAGQSYDAVGMAVEAIKAVGTDRAQIRDWLASRTTPEKAYKGVTGPTYFDEKRDVQKPVFFAIVKGGKFSPAPMQPK